MISGADQVVERRLLLLGEVPARQLGVICNQLRVVQVIHLIGVLQWRHQHRIRDRDCREGDDDGNRGQCPAMFSHEAVLLACRSFRDRVDIVVCSDSTRRRPKERQSSFVSISGFARRGRLIRAAITSVITVLVLVLVWRLLGHGVKWAGIHPSVWLILLAAFGAACFLVGRAWRFGALLPAARRQLARVARRNGSILGRRTAASRAVGGRRVRRSGSNQVLSGRGAGIRKRGRRPNPRRRQPRADRAGRVVLHQLG